jgi:hypothetical protein
VKVEIGKYILEFPMMVAEINDDCLLGADFLKKLNLDNVFESAFGNINKNILDIDCARVEVSSQKVPSLLEELFIKHSKNLNFDQQEIFASFLDDFKDVFSREIVAGNCCDAIEHVINVKDSSPIKQVPRRIPIHMREEVDKLIVDMRNQGVIEESQSPWISPAVLIRKKDGSLRSRYNIATRRNTSARDQDPETTLRSISQMFVVCSSQ